MLSACSSLVASIISGRKQYYHIRMKTKRNLWTHKISFIIVFLAISCSLISNVSSQYYRGVYDNENNSGKVIESGIIKVLGSSAPRSSTHNEPSSIYNRPDYNRYPHDRYFPTQGYGYQPQPSYARDYPDPYSRNKPGYQSSYSGSSSSYYPGGPSSYPGGPSSYPGGSTSYSGSPSYSYPGSSYYSREYPQYNRYNYPYYNYYPTTYSYPSYGYPSNDRPGQRYPPYNPDRSGYPGYPGGNHYGYPGYPHSHGTHGHGGSYPGTVRPVRASAALRGSNNGTTFGTIYFEQINNNMISISGRLTGLAPGAHGLHVYESGITNGECESIGEHYNPQKNNHGGKADWIRHVGDLGNIFADSHGVAYFTITDNLIALTGAYNIIGRSIGVTANPDDLGKGDTPESKRDGNSGLKIACGVVEGSRM